MDLRLNQYLQINSLALAALLFRGALPFSSLRRW